MNMTEQEFIKKINRLRLDNKDNWYYFRDIVNGKDIQIKGYNNWMQILKVNEISFPTCMGGSVKSFKEDLSQAYNYKGE
jgi:hypothetical protein